MCMMPIKHNSTLVQKIDKELLVIDLGHGQSDNPRRSCHLNGTDHGLKLNEVEQFSIMHRQAFVNSGSFPWNTKESYRDGRLLPTTLTLPLLNESSLSMIEEKGEKSFLTK